MKWAILIALACVHALWVHYVAVMRLKQLRDAGTLTTGQKVMGYPALVVGLLLDLGVHMIVGTLLFAELPARGEWTLSARLWRLSTTGTGWRQRLALWLRRELLDSADPSGVHRG